MKYIHKPTEVEAIRYRGGNQSIEEVLDFTGKFGVKNNIVEVRKDILYIKNPNGELVVNIGDYIIKGEKEGDFWVCTPDVFEKSYEGERMTELKSCPFCGSTDISREYNGIGCNRCHTFVKSWGWTTETIEEKWNRRVKE